MAVRLTYGRVMYRCGVVRLCVVMRYDGKAKLGMYRDGGVKISTASAK